jgi:tRNA U34 5-methylaminomethyl-2-thiouridine-forming methyltransferase MnmC
MRFVPAPLPIPDVEWRDGALHSRAYDDCYSSRNGARAEREHVFLRSNGFGAVTRRRARGATRRDRGTGT